jgi:hypothetical protein
MTISLDDYAELLKPAKIWKASELLNDSGPIPKTPGIYAWYFETTPALTPTANCHTHQGLTLLYIGIAKSSAESDKTLHKRLHNHLKGNASQSTFRMTLGCLLSKELGLQLKQGDDERLTFEAGEDKLSEWLSNNASVIWMEMPEPWLVEAQLIQQLSLPLNLEHNSTHPFYSELTALRKTAKAAARAN